VTRYVTGCIGARAYRYCENIGCFGPDTDIYLFTNTQEVTTQSAAPSKCIHSSNQKFNTDRTSIGRPIYTDIYIVYIGIPMYTAGPALHMLDDVERKVSSLTVKSRSQADIRSLFGAGTFRTQARIQYHSEV
jgi:hypothetical protein